MAAAAPTGAVVRPLRTRPREDARRAAPAGRPARGVAVPPRPALRAVPRRSRAFGFATAAMAFVSVLMLGLVVFQTRIAQDQLVLDRLEVQVREASARYDLLRRERAELRAPARIAAEAASLGMTQGTVDEFITVPPDVAAAVYASAGWLTDDRFTAETDHLAEWSDVKESVGGRP